MNDRHPAADAKLGPAQLPPPTLIANQNFPTPEIAYGPGAIPGGVEAFATFQAESANAIATGLDVAVVENGGFATADIFRQHGHLASVKARASKASEFSGGRSEMPITDSSPNVDTYGTSLGRYRTDAGKTFVVREQGRVEVFVGGDETRASGEMARCRAWVDERFEQEGNSGESLQNYVTLPDGRVVKGNVLLRGQAFVDEVSKPDGPRTRLHAQKAANAQLPPEKQNKALLSAEFEISPELACTVTATEEDRTAIREAMYQYAADLYNNFTAAGRITEITLEHIAHVAYMITQAPMTKRGSDAAGREEFMAILSALRVNPLPKMPQDIDLAGYIKGQVRFVREFVELNS